MSSIHTSPHLQISSLRDLGLQSARLGEPVRVARRRLSATRRLRDPELGFDGPLFPPASQPAFEVGGLMLQTCASAHGDVLRVVAPDNPALGVAATGRDVTPWAQAPGESGAVFIAPAEDSAYSVVGPDGRGVLVVHEAGKGIYAYGVAPTSDAVRAPTAVHLEAPRWLAAARPLWLHRVISRHLHAGTPYAIAAAVGAYARLADTDPDDATAAISLVLAGLADSDTARPHGWFAALEPGARRAVACAAIAHAHALGDALIALRNARERNEGADADHLPMLHARDDLEGVRVLLQCVGGDAPVDRAIAGIDRAGLRLASTGRLDALATADARRRRGAAADPTAWWAGAAGD